jgi:hypothetical protein
MQKTRIVWGAILLSSCIALIGCDGGNDRSGDRKGSPAEKGTPNTPPRPALNVPTAGGERAFGIRLPRHRHHSEKSNTSLR